MIKVRPITNVIGILLFMEGFLMLTCLGFSIYYDSHDMPALLKSGLITMGCGVGLRLYTKGRTDIAKREGYLIVALGWLSLLIFGTLPFILSGVTDSITDAFFETASGLTTTGATIFEDIESLPEGILFWRSLTQWIGGMGIIVLTVAIFPLLGIAGIELFVAEAPGPTSDKIHPRITVTARRLWIIYLALTGILIVILWLMDMTLFDAMCHAFTTMATGGFSPKNASVGYYGPAIQYVIILFMFIGGTNYTVIYFALSGQLKRVWRSDEFRAYLFFVLGLAVIVAAVLVFNGYFGVEEAFRKAIFHIISLMTTTGYVTDDYTSWGLGLTAVFFLLFFSGACAGSTSGGIKIVRHLVFVKNSIVEFNRLLHRRAIIRIKINQEVVAPRILMHILVFLLIYLAIFSVGIVFVSAFKVEFTSAAGAVAASLGNVGPAIGSVGPASTYAHLPGAVKVFLGCLMLLGRLELFTILVLFTPYFWRKSG
jgi:trk system potassium uptake protein TrkH